MKEYLLLFIYWILFFLFHSVFATNFWKAKMQMLLKANYKYYRMLYSLFAALTLVAILAYNLFIPAYVLWNSSFAEQVFSIILITSGFIVMSLFTKRFFFNLSGVDVLKKKQANRELIQSDFYKHVRHPLYSATIVFVWGIFLYKPLLSNLISCASITIYTVAGIYLEEKKLINEFGNNYIDYRSKTPMLVPKLFRSK